MNISPKKCKIVKLPNGHIIDHIKDFITYFPNPIYKKRYDINKVQFYDCLCAIKIEDTLNNYNIKFKNINNIIEVINLNQ